MRPGSTRSPLMGRPSPLAGEEGSEIPTTSPRVPRPALLRRGTLLLRLSRAFHGLTGAFALGLLGLFLALVAVLAEASWGSIVHYGPGFLSGQTWDPVHGIFGAWPFVADRVIDLSLSAAQAIEMVGTGTSQVRLEVIAGPNPVAGVFAVQIGAFLKQENAQNLKALMEARNLPVTIVTFDSANGLLYRVRVGRLATEDAANQLAVQLHSTDQFTTFVVRLDE